jgi:spermidine synthase
MSLDDSWFTETDSGFGMLLKIQQRIYEEQTPFQKIEIYQTETFGRLMTLDGITMLTSRDNFIYHEMMTHPVMFSHSYAKDVVIVGGGDCGSLREILKHGEVKKVVQVELDERVTRVSEEFFPELCEANHDPRVEFLFEDAIAWMREAEAESVDVLVLDTTDPVGQAARLFSEDFYADCSRVLKKSGILIAQSESPLLNHGLMKSMQESMRAVGFDDIVPILFPQPTYPSGWWSATMARKGQKLNSYRETAVRKKLFATQYYNADIHVSSQAIPEFLREAFEA